MFVAKIKNRNSNPTYLIRHSYRENGKVKTKTIANLTKLPPRVIDVIRRMLQGESFVSADESFDIVSSAGHGHVEAVLTMMRKLDMEKVIWSQRCRERKLVLGLIAARILAASSKLHTSRWWKTTTLPDELRVGDVDEKELYAAMDWLLPKQASIEKKLAGRHLQSCDLVLYDLSSTWVEGQCCPLAAHGHSRDRKKGKKQINFGLLTDDEGRPVSISVYEGNTGDPRTVQEQVLKLKQKFGVKHVVFIGDRGMVTQAQIDNFVEQDGVEWISALKSGAIRKLKSQGQIQLDLFDERNLFELSSPEFPDERLVACRNPELAKRRSRKRKELIEATRKEIEFVKGMIKRGRLIDRADIALRVGKVINKHKVAKHFKLDIANGKLSYRVRQDKVNAEAALDGIYVIRTSLPEDVVSAEDAVRHYKRLTRVERAFRAMKTVDLHVRPIYHWSEDRVRAHFLLCMLAYYVEWHLRRAWAPLLFEEEEDTLMSRDPVAAARPGAAAKRKASTKKTRFGEPVHSFSSLLAHLATVARNRCRRKDAPKDEMTFDIYTQRDALQKRALKFIEAL